MSEDQNKEIPIEISPSQLSPQALAGIIENFILREGTDYGSVEVPYEKKVQQIRRQIDTGKIRIIFDQFSETVSLLSDTEFHKLISKLK